MKLEFLNQKCKLDFDIQKEYPMIWHKVDEKKVNELSISPVKGSIEISGDVIVDTGDLKIADCLRLAKAIHTLDEIVHKKDGAGCRMIPDPSGPPV